MQQAVERTESYSNVRVRFQRLSDAKFFAGWVRQMSDEELVLDFGGSDWFELGTKFYATVNGVESAAHFPAELANQSPGFMTLRITGGIRYTKPTEEARRSVVGLNGVLHMGQVQIDVQIQDVSLKGFGGIIEGNLPRGTIIDFDVDTQFGAVIGKAEVRYCKQESKDSMRHRIGLRIQQMGRIETARWQRLSDEGNA
jgi:hypothetical protein